ncbi:phosphoribosylglycinamide formyltransferase [Aliikangiella marina]|uniref:Phosphoribosylglycinamide formyltransferase n=1 Tax=Aliikangiella marina TaxID=1712262 RepID=A0A545TI10_9GAMM|nr:phosphoribosylglycinamide formyltransferase [Aliikangiella marina]TQV76864.1 phosphoribosylglycinamide formyltransferase [Aliikangiella marina]
MSNKRVVVLISGSGSNLQAFIEAEKAGNLHAKIVGVISNKSGVFGLERAAKANIPTRVIEHGNFDSREAFDEALAKTIESFSPNLVILAGFMRILSAGFVQKFNGKLLNIHPSLLPKYTGLHTHRRALENKDTFHGTSVHFVTEELDGGPVIGQARLKLDLNDSESEVMAKVQQLEHKLYPEVASWFLTERLSMESEGIYFDNEKLTHPIIIDSE